ncbi:uncharacterized protein EAF01_004605 [Botrytis porri]|uniref:Uncharacterized protein n=1 Tax=Botrytis porri TaxID=87229 RepID=A0A4Z1L1G3_9HELO|nr:uncharacterized protein EAF01_004605 [Botrytis porri]KAF7907018.1 hypothetical protein EAF01_004605 [Botrytis porri]TGO90536.1 hypothetical protein BPOR_0060g00090 [Botrytis porri]
MEYEKLPDAGPWNIWRTGKLHSEKANMDADVTDKRNLPPVLLYSEYNVAHSGLSKGKYLILDPSGNATSSQFSIGFRIRVSKKTNQEMLVVFTGFVSKTMTEDRLLVDDETFSRSKKYFWAISILKELHVRISKNVEETERVMEDPRIRSGTASTSLGLNCEDIRKKLKALQDIANRLSDEREEALALRDGLFNASGVMESQASTQLGENIKLLTFVSIFFLSLSFSIVQSILHPLENFNRFNNLCYGLQSRQFDVPVPSVAPEADEPVYHANERRK